MIPGVDIINKLEAGAGVRMDRNLQKLCYQWIQKNNITDDIWYLNLYFGTCQEKGLEKIARFIFENYPAPLLRISFNTRAKNQIESIQLLSLEQLNDEEQNFFAEALDRFNKKVWRAPQTVKSARYSLAVLYDPEEKFPPSNKQAINKLLEVAEAEAKAARERERRAREKAKAEGKEPVKEPVQEERVADTKGGYAMTRAEKKLSDDFAGNRGRLPFPVAGRYTIVGTFGEQQHQELKYVRTNNSGIDIQTNPGAEARAVFNGEVTRVFVVPGYNNSVIIRHGNYLTVYSNLSQVYVKAGDKVSTRQTIGKIFTDTESGNATILHFQLWKEKTKLNPTPWLD